MKNLQKKAMDELEGLECSDRSENLTIRKSCQSWIEIDTQFFFQLRKIMLLGRFEKIVEEMLVPNRDYD